MKEIGETRRGVVERVVYVVKDRVGDKLHGIGNSVMALEATIKEWWRQEGFYIVKDVRYVPGEGLRFWLGMYVDDGGCRDKRLELRRRLEESGMDMVDANIGFHIVQDTGSSRRAVRELVKGLSTCTEVIGYESYAFREREGEYIQGVDIMLAERGGGI